CYPKISLELHMGPMVKWIAHGMRNRSRPGSEFIQWISVSSDIFLINTKSSHRTPFIMISCQPSFRNICVHLGIVYFSWRQMVVIVNNRHISGVIKIELLGVLITQDKIIV